MSNGLTCKTRVNGKNSRAIIYDLADFVRRKVRTFLGDAVFHDVATALKK